MSQRLKVESDLTQAQDQKPKTLNLDHGKPETGKHNQR